MQSLYTITELATTWKCSPQQLHDALMTMGIGHHAGRLSDDAVLALCDYRDTIARLEALTAQIRQPKPTSIRVELKSGMPAKVNRKGKVPSFSAVAYSGGIVPGYTATPRSEHDYIIDLAGMKPGRSMKANLDHKGEQRVGHLTAYHNDGRQVIVKGLISAATEHARTVAEASENTYPWEVSIEASLSGKRLLPSGKSEYINGRQVAGPLYVFGQSVLTAVAFVAAGADAGNAVEFEPSLT